MEMLQINKLRKSNQIPFTIVNWLKELSPIVEHDDVGMMYKGYILAEDGYGKYTAIIGTTDRLLKASLESTSNDAQYKILKIDEVWS